MVVFAIKNGKKYLQRFDANENYKKAVRAIQTCAHLPSEFVPVWGESPNWMDCRTAGGYLRDLAHCISRNNMNIRHLSIEIGNE